MKARANGEGRIFRPWYRDKVTGERKQTATWWVQYHDQRKPKTKQKIRESSKSEDRRVAVRLLRRRLADLEKGRPSGPDVEKTTLGDLHTMILTDYRINERRSIGRLREALAHLTGTDDTEGGFFGKATRAIHVTEDRLAAFIAHRLDEGAKNATINRELACVRRMFRLGMKAHRVAYRPEITMLAERNVRKGFLQSDQIRAVIAYLPEDLRAVVEVASVTGWRVASEVLTRQWRHVDFEGGWIRLEPGESKNSEGRMFPFTPELTSVLERQRQRTIAAEQSSGSIIPWVFHRNGEPIRTFRRAWITACKKAGVPGKIPHDMRRSAVRRLEAAGVPRTVAMKLVGHKTESIYRRYAIVAEAEMRDAAVKLAALTRPPENPEAKVVSITEGNKPSS
jgi:integrase